MPNETLFSVKEAAVLAHTTEKAIRNDIQRRVIVTVRRKRKIALDAATVYYLRLINEVPLPLTKELRSGLYATIKRKNGGATSWHVSKRGLSYGMVTLDTAKVRSAFAKDVDLYRTGMERIERRDDTLGGAAVFKGTRLAVRHIGLMARNGVPDAEIRADYPSLSQADIDFAKLYSEMRPGPGRPTRLKFKRG